MWAAQLAHESPNRLARRADGAVQHSHWRRDREAAAWSRQRASRVW